MSWLDRLVSSRSLLIVYNFACSTNLLKKPTSISRGINQDRLYGEVNTPTKTEQIRGRLEPVFRRSASHHCHINITVICCGAFGMRAEQDHLTHVECFSRQLGKCLGTFYSIALIHW